MRQAAVILLLALAASACAPAAAPSVTLRGVAVAGPVCPVVTQPADPACADRPVADAEIIVRRPGGEPIARVRTGDDGTFAVSLAPGRYELVAQPVDGMQGVPGPVDVVLEAGSEPAAVELSYDTGIR